MNTASTVERIVKVNGSIYRCAMEAKKLIILNRGSSDQNEEGNKLVMQEGSPWNL